MRFEGGGVLLEGTPTRRGALEVTPKKGEPNATQANHLSPGRHGRGSSFSGARRTVTRRPTDRTPEHFRVSSASCRFVSIPTASS